MVWLRSQLGHELANFIDFSETHFPVNWKWSMDYMHQDPGMDWGLTLSGCASKGHPDWAGHCLSACHPQSYWAPCSRRRSLPRHQPIACFYYWCWQHHCFATQDYVRSCTHSLKTERVLRWQHRTHWGPPVTDLCVIFLYLVTEHLALSVPCWSSHLGIWSKFDFAEIQGSKPGRIAQIHSNCIFQLQAILDHQFLSREFFSHDSLRGNDIHNTTHTKETRDFIPRGKGFKEWSGHKWGDPPCRGS